MADGDRLLTKSLFMRGGDCYRRAWLDLNRPNLREPMGVVDQERMETGKRVGALAWDRYPGGISAFSPGLPSYDAARLTQDLIAQGERTIFEATFISEGRLARLDILSLGDEGWIADEVKSSTIKEPSELTPKITELAFQTLTIRDSGLPISRARLVLIDSSYRWASGPILAGDMLGAVDVSEDCFSLEPLRAGERSAASRGVAGSRRARRRTEYALQEMLLFQSLPRRFTSSRLNISSLD